MKEFIKKTWRLLVTFVILLFVFGVSQCKAQELEIDTTFVSGLNLEGSLQLGNANSWYYHSDSDIKFLTFKDYSVDGEFSVTRTSIRFPKEERYILKIYNDKNYMIMKFKLKPKDNGLFPIRTEEEQSGLYYLRFYQKDELISKIQLIL